MPSPTYTLLEPLAPARAHIRFTGRFEGRAVTWDAQIIALHATGSHAAPYIEIAPTARTGGRCASGCRWRRSMRRRSPKP